MGFRLELLLFAFHLVIFHSVMIETIPSNVFTSTSTKLEIVKNAAMNVNYGRATKLTSDNLKIRYEKGSTCKISVLNVNPFSSRIGSFIPSVFPCDFEEGSVHYQHFGSMSQSVEKIKLQVRVDTEHDTYLKSFQFTVNIGLYQPFEILKRVENLVVDEIGGLSEPFSENVIGLRYDPYKQTCRVRFLATDKGPPFYGSLVNSSDPNGLGKVSNFKDISCDEFQKGNLRYAHQRSRRTSNRDYLPFVVELYDKISSLMVKREFIQIPVRIRRAPENQPPIVNYNDASYSLQVDQLVLTALTPSVLRVEDRETDSDSIVFNITQQYEASDGFLVHTDDPSTPVRTFYQKDVKDLKIAYKASEQLTTTQRMQPIYMEARDSYGAASSTFYVIIVIKPMNSFAPRVIRNEVLSMFEGQSRVISRDTLSIRDPDNEAEVVIRIAAGLKNGRLERFGKSVTKLRMGDITERRVRYVHDGSDTTSDNIVFHISDGKHTVQVLFVVLIVPRDDQAPQLTYNTGLDVEEGETKMIGQFQLSASDVDSDDTKVTYKILNAPSAGSIVYRQSDTPADFVKRERQWKLKSESYERPVMEFTQVDVILGRIFYRHSGAEVFQDMFTFRLFDNAPVPNQSGIKTFIVVVEPVDDLAPILFPGCPLSFDIPEDQPGIFTKHSLRFVDGDSSDEEISYKVTSQPFFLKTGTSAGNLYVSKDGRSEITDTFTQKYVNHFKVRYVPTSHLSLLTKSSKVLFKFDVTDTAGNLVSNQNFSIGLMAVKNKPPTYQANILSVIKGERRLISLASLNAQDEDNSLEELSFIVKRLPTHGALVNSASLQSVGSSIRLVDIREKRVSYLHAGGGDSTDDIIKFVLTDGVNLVSAQLRINIIQTNAPANNNKHFESNLNVAENGVVEIGRSALGVSNRARRSYTEGAKEISFQVNPRPRHGRVEKKGLSTDVFTLEEIATGQIAYRHTNGEVGQRNLRDVINLDVAPHQDDVYIGGMLFSGMKVNVDIMPVDSQPPVINGPSMIEVEESKKTVLNLNVTDEDTSPQHVWCNITEFPLFGFIENTTPLDGSEIERPGLPVTSFRMSDANEGKVRYVQSKHQKIEQDIDSFSLRCYDGNNTSSETKIHVAIAPVNDEAPILFIQNQIVCIEGDLIIFDLSKINPFDRDRPYDKLMFTVTEQPINGELLLQNNSALTPATTFEYEVLSGGTDRALIYQHRGTETTKDQFELSVSDGIHVVSQLVNITVIPMDDEQPRLVVNTGLRIDRGHSKTITTRNLKAKDLDSEDSTLLFIIMIDAVSGKLQKLNVSGMYSDLMKGSNFTQLDIDKKQIRYTHLNLKSDERDLIRLDVTDGFNRLINQMFNIIITPEDNVIPIVVNKGLSLPENSRALLNTDVLSASDINTPDENLQFVVTRLPLKGFLEQSDSPGVPLTSFLQLDLAANKISYLHTSLDEIKVDNFEFEVTDGQNKVFRTFRIQIDSVDNKLPVLQTSVIFTGQGQEKIITPFELNSKDNDTQGVNIFFQIHRPPKHGVIYLDGASRTFRFTQKDITENRVSYQHDGSIGKRDEFTVTTSDGVNDGFYLLGKRRIQNKPILINIEITAVDKNAPVIVTNKMVSSLRTRNNKIFTKLSMNVLEAVDAHSDDNSIIYNITIPPKEGRLINVKNKGVTITQFSQDDVNKRVVEYLLNSTSSATTDIFFFDVLDKNGNALRGQNFKLKWARVCTQNERVTVEESDAKVGLNFKRFGNLQPSAFATLVIRKQFSTDNPAFVENEKVVHWGPGKEIASASLQLIDDETYDERRLVSITLKDGVNTLVGENCNMTVLIKDPNDEPIVSIEQAEFEVDEWVGILKIPLKRRGDTSKVTSLRCVTQSGSARGTSGYAVTSYHDFISRFDEDDPSIVTFEEGEVEKTCEIRIIDDTSFETDESFKVKVKALFGGKVDQSKSQTVVTILNDPRDKLEFSFEKTEFRVSEDIGFIRLTVRRDGIDRSFKSYVQIMTKEQVPVSAKSDEDYKSLLKTLEFGVGVTSVQVNLQIYDDEFRPKVEGDESFSVVLRNPRNGKLSSTHSRVVVTIHDHQNDGPTVGFEATEYDFKEISGTVKIPIVREGDLSQEVSVICYTRQATARVVTDFVERPKTFESQIKFKRFEKTKYCEVEIVDDSFYEEEEVFTLNLHSEDMSVRIPNINRTRIVIEDDDKPRVSFSERKYFFYEPSKIENQNTVYIQIIRNGDLTIPTSVSLETSDGSALSGQHYEPFAKTVKFSAGLSKVTIPVKLFHSKKVNVRLAFTLLLRNDPDDSMSLIEKRKSVVTIEERRVQSDVTFPLKPMVVSLTDYADVSKAKSKAVNGYPLVCVTACDPHFPMFAKTSAICNQERILNNMTVYRWQIQSDDVVGGFRDVSLPVFFTKTNSITLDSIYFTAKSKVRCVARAYSLDGGLGLESKSKVIEVSDKDGICRPRNKARLAENSFSAQISYTGNSEVEHKNMVKLRVLIPHYDGLLPIISTKRPHNFDLILGPDPSRSKQHVCSNLLNKNEVSTKMGFLTSTQSTVYASQPYEHNFGLRSENNVRFYENLNLDSCLWIFESYYDMNELVSLCGGSIVAEGLVRNSVQSNLILNIPLFVSYLYPSNNGRFVEYSHESSFRLTAVYDTGALWSDGVGLSKGKLEGSLYPASIIVLNKDNRLLFKFKTKAAFRGVFIKETNDGKRKSSVVSRDNQLLTFTLRHVKSEETFNEPTQEWEMTSDMAVRDYSGVYIFKLIPCVVENGVDFSWPPICTAKEEVTFEVPLSIHQTSKPVETTFTLNTKFVVTKQDDVELEKNQFPDNVAFDEGDNIFGRVTVDSNNEAYRVRIEKVLLCAGQDGYIPAFNPDDKEFGCLVDTDRLMYRFQVLNRMNPSYETKEFGQIPFEASFTKQKGASDGFKINSTPLFKAGNGRTWYLHVVYKVRSSRRKNKRQRRDDISGGNDEQIAESAILHHMTSSGSSMGTRLQRLKRDVEKELKEIRSIGRKKGTNLKMLRLNRPKAEYVSKQEDKTSTKESKTDSKLIYGVVGGFLVLLLVIVAFAVYRNFIAVPASSTKETQL